MKIAVIRTGENEFAQFNLSAPEKMAAPLVEDPIFFSVHEGDPYLNDPYSRISFANFDGKSSQVFMSVKIYDKGNVNEIRLIDEDLEKVKHIIKEIYLSEVLGE